MYVGVGVLFTCVHIAGAEIETDMTQALQKKLDDAVLELLRDILTRNRMCKLMSDDVGFIQPVGMQPSCTVYFSLSASGLRRPAALACYVRQNLLEFLFRPNFGAADDCFRDYSATDIPPIAETDIFLYNTAQQSSSRGQCMFLDSKNATQQQESVTCMYFLK